MSTSPSFICPGCQRVLRTAAVAAGSRIRCPACQTVFAPPAEDPRPASPIRPAEDWAAPARRLDEEQDRWAERPRRRFDAKKDWEEERTRRGRRPRQSGRGLI